MQVLLTFKIQDAVCKSTLDRDTKHLLMVMALLAGGTTGEGTSGQATIARAMGCTDRHVRKLLARLDANPGTPVRVVRQRRSTATGRTSDKYTLLLTQPEQHSGEADPNRNTVPVPQPEHHDAPTGTPRPPKRNVRSEDQRSDQRSDQRRSSAPVKPKRRKAAAKVPVPGAHELKLHYVAEFNRTRGVEPNFAKGWSRAMAAFGELVEAHTLETSKQIVTKALSDTYVRRINPWELKDDANKYTGKRPSNPKDVAVQRTADDSKVQQWGRGRTAPRQPDSGYRPSQHATEIK